MQYVDFLALFRDLQALFLWNFIKMSFCLYLLKFREIETTIQYEWLWGQLAHRKIVQVRYVFALLCMKNEVYCTTCTIRFIVNVTMSACLTIGPVSLAGVLGEESSPTSDTRWQPLFPNIPPNFVILPLAQWHIYSFGTVTQFWCSALVFLRLSGPIAMMLKANFHC